MTYFLIIAVFFLSYSNGANDNFKGVATLYGSNTLNYRQALVLATAATLAGSICSYYLAETLLRNFSGKGIVPDAVLQSTDFIFSVALASGTTVLLATKLGFPVSTTHALVGSLLGTGIVAVGSAVNFYSLGKSFFLPLLISPALALSVAAMLYLVFRFVRKITGVHEKTALQFVTAQSNQETEPGLTGYTTVAIPQYAGNLLGIKLQVLLNMAHYFSAATVSFARGLNDTPKLASLLLISTATGLQLNFVLIALFIAIGGILNARKVAETMSKKVTTLNHGQGFTASLVTGTLVIIASKLGLPVSTTHVSVGSIFGIGLVNKTADKKEISKIAFSWLLTLPVAGILSGLFYYIIHLINH